MRGSSVRMPAVLNKKEICGNQDSIRITHVLIKDVEGTPGSGWVCCFNLNAHFFQWLLIHK